MKKNKVVNIAGAALLGGAFILAATGPSQAFNINQQTNFNLGKLGTYSIVGAASLYGAISSQGTPAGSTQQHAATGIGAMRLNIEKTTGLLQFNVGFGLNGPATLGGTSFLRPYGSSQNPVSGGLILNQLEVTLAPAELHGFSLTAGRLTSYEGLEAGSAWDNTTGYGSQADYVEELINLQGVQISYASPSGAVQANVQWTNGNDTARYNSVSAYASYQLNSHINLSGWGNGTVGQAARSPYVAAYNANNQNLAGVGATLTYGKYTFTPYVQAGWIGKTDDGAVKTTKAYYNFEAVVPVLYQFNQHWSLGGLVQYATSNKAADPAQEQYATWFSNGGAGASMVGIAVAPGWQYGHLFTRVSLGMNHLMNYQAGQGYGHAGTHDNVYQALGEVGFTF